jgi:Na+-translocating ferredoxin:NAD+ oxidoreductase RnfD subunit
MFLRMIHINLATRTATAIGTPWLRLRSSATTNNEPLPFLGFIFAFLVLGCLASISLYVFGFIFAFLVGRSNYGGLIDPTFRGAGGVD